MRGFGLRCGSVSGACLASVLRRPSITAQQRVSRGPRRALIHKLMLIYEIDLRSISRRQDIRHVAVTPIPPANTQLFGCEMPNNADLSSNTHRSNATDEPQPPSHLPASSVMRASSSNGPPPPPGFTSSRARQQHAHDAPASDMPLLFLE